MQNENLPVPVKSPERVSITAVSLPYGATLAQSLVQYAAEDVLFAWQLERVAEASLPGSNDGASFGAFSTASADILLPEDYTQAMSRLQWLIQQMPHETLPGTAEAGNLLTTWAAHRKQEDPRNLVVGVIKIAIPGVTLGRLSRKREVMRLILRHDVLHRTDVARMHYTTRTALDTFAQTLRIADGDIRQLEPEVLDWFLDGQEIAFYAAQEHTMAGIAQELGRLDIPHAGVADGHGLAILALSPAVTGIDRIPHWEINPVD